MAENKNKALRQYWLDYLRFIMRSKMSDNTAAPVSQNEKATASVSQNDTTAASVSQNDTATAPVSQNDTTTAPVSQNDTTTAPVSQNDMTTAPVTQSDKVTAPATQNNMATAPVTENEKTTAPVTPNVMTTAPVIRNEKAAARVIQTDKAAALSTPTRTPLTRASKATTPVAPLTRASKATTPVAQTGKATIPLTKPNMNTRPLTLVNTRNLASKTFKIVESQTKTTTFTKEAVVKLYRLPERTVNQLLARLVPSSPAEPSKNVQQKEVLAKDLIRKMESRLTLWVKKKARKNGGRVQKDKVTRKAKQIFQKLKAQGGEKYKNVKFNATKKWYNRYRMKTGFFVKHRSRNPSVCHCNVMSSVSIKSSVSTPDLSGDNENWCLQTKSDLIHKKARDLMFPSCPFLTCVSDKRQEKSTAGAKSREDLSKQRDDLRKQCATPMPMCGPESESISHDSGDDDSSSDVLLLSQLKSKIGNSANNCMGDVQPDLITLDDDDEEMPSLSSVSTLLVSTLTGRESPYSEREFGAVENSTWEVPFFQSVNNDNESVQHFRQKLEKILKQEKYLPQQIFCAHETTLYWKHMPSGGIRESIDGKSLESKDPMMLLLCTNASGDCRFEPMIVYSKEDPSSIRHLIRSSLPVIWKYHPRAKVTKSLFEDWFTYSFLPTVQVFCMEHQIPFKIVLLLDSVPCHNPILEFANPNVKVVFISSDISPYVQPMNQGITTTFKVNYLRRLFEMIAESVELENGETLQSFLSSFNVLSVIKLIKTAWLDVPQAVVTLAWKIMCFGSIPRDCEGEIPYANVVAHTISAANRLKVSFSERDLKNWLYYQSHDLTNEELKVLEQRNSMEAASSRSEEPRATLTSAKLLEAFRGLATAMRVFETEDPNFKRSSFVVDELKRSYQCYREVYLELKANEQENSIENVSQSVKVEDEEEDDEDNDEKPVVNSPSGLVKWLSTSTMNST